MKISSIHLQNFKRFSDLFIGHIPQSAKLVLLIGANGSGKSCLFDAFNFMDAAIKKDIAINDEFLNYFKKKKDESTSVKIEFEAGDSIEISSDDFVNPSLAPTAFYGRTSFRQLSRLTRTSLGQAGAVYLQNDPDRPHFFIDKDNRFENDIEKITEDILKDLFRSKESNEQIRQKYINPINEALDRIFGGNNGTKLQLIEIIPPLEGKVAQIHFRKGTSEIHYNYLSAGEKEVFNLLINLLSRASLYQNTIYFFDEIDLHLNTKLQFNLLKELTENWLPENAQLWTASHALGFIEYAKQSDAAVILDFDDWDYDLPRILSPEPKDNPDIYEIAVGKEFLPFLFRKMNIFFVENKDKEFYASLGLSDTIFVSDNNRNNVYHKVRATQYKGIVDRDFLSDEDRVLILEHYPNLRILHYYSIENYLYHPDNLLEYYHSINQSFDKDLYILQLTDAKNQVKDLIIPSLSLKRTEYPYFGEPSYQNTTFQNRFKNKRENEVEAAIVASYLNSNEFEVFYQSLPMKSYCTQLLQRQNIAKSELAKTTWFRMKIGECLREN